MNHNTRQQKKATRAVAIQEITKLRRRTQTQTPSQTQTTQTHVRATGPLRPLTWASMWTTANAMHRKLQVTNSKRNATTNSVTTAATPTQTKMMAKVTRRQQRQGEQDDNSNQRIKHKCKELQQHCLRTTKLCKHMSLRVAQGIGPRRTRTHVSAIFAQQPHAKHKVPQRTPDGEEA